MTPNKKKGWEYIFGPLVLLVAVITAYAIVVFFATTLGATEESTAMRVINVILGLAGIVAVILIPIGVIMGIVYLTKKEEAVVPAVGVPAAGQPTVRYAGFWLRWLAAIIDGIILAAIVGLASTFFAVSSSANFSDFTDQQEPLINAVSLLIGWLYYALMEISHFQGTLGKLALGIKVTDLGGQKLGFGRATGRYFGKILSAIPFSIGFIIAGFTEKKQALHDLLAGCLVVRK